MQRRIIQDGSNGAASRQGTWSQRRRQVVVKLHPRDVPLIYRRRNCVWLSPSIAGPPGGWTRVTSVAGRSGRRAMAPAALDLVTGLDEDTVITLPDNHEFTADVTIPATRSAIRHHGVEYRFRLSRRSQRAIHCWTNPSAQTHALHSAPTCLRLGSKSVGLEGIKKAYETGAAQFKTRVKE